MANHSPLPQTLIILSGLPGCGNTTLARLLVQELQGVGMRHWLVCYTGVPWKKT